MNILEIIRNNDLEAVKEWLKSNDVNKQYSNGWTPLIYAAKFDCCEIAELLIKNGADVNLKNNHGRSAIFYAKLNKRQAMTKILEKYR